MSKSIDAFLKGKKNNLLIIMCSPVGNRTRIKSLGNSHSIR